MNEVYVRIIKKTEGHANEESFKIVAGSTEVYTSPPLVDNQEQLFEACLSASINQQYTLHMLDSSVTWSSGAWIMIIGRNGNTVFKGIMTDINSQLEPISLYSPINKNEEWKYSESAPGEWRDILYPDSSWMSVVMGSSTVSVSGTQYFRKLFTGIDDMAALELQMKYQEGVVAYINGIEVYRDNMPKGEPVNSTTATGSYSTCDYHGVIRPADGVSVSNVIAVEVHFTDLSHQETIQFNGFISLLAGMSSTNNCFVVPSNVSVVESVGFDDPMNTVSWKMNSHSSLLHSLGSITYGFTESSLPLINSFRFWIGSAEDMLRVFRMEGSKSISLSWEPLFSVNGVVYEENTWKQWDLVSTSPMYPLIKLSAISSQSKNAHMNGLQFLVCNRPYPTTIEYPQTQYSFVRSVEQVSIVPVEYGFSGCSISPSLPEGVSLDSNTCIISGVSKDLSPATPYTIRSVMGNVQRQANLTIEFTDCEGTLYRITRTYQKHPDIEYFRIRDTSNGNIIFEAIRAQSYC